MVDTRVRPTYGNFRRPQSAGLFGLGRLGMVVMAASLFTLIIVVATRGLLWGLVVLAIALLALGGIAYKKDGRNVYERVVARVTGGTARMAGTNLYRSGPLGRGQWGTYQLPGIAAPTRLYEYEDSYGRPFVLVYTPRAKTFTVVIESSPDGASRVDESQVDAWVADWGQWLANLGDEPGLAAASVTIETAPDTGRRLRREVEVNLDPSAPELAKQVLRTATNSAPVGASTVRAFIAIVFEASPRVGAKARTPDEMGRELGNRLPTYTASLEATGAGSAQPMSAQELCEVVRVAYDPAAALLIDEAYSEGVVPDLAWSDVGPTDHEAGRKVYQHDNAWSVTWAMTEPPRGNVQSSVLARMLRPHKDIARKRVTLIYRPYDSARAAALVEADIRASNFITTSKARPSYRLVREQRIANVTAQEEANGAGLVNFAMLVTATSTSRENREAASAAISFLSATAKLRLRVMGSMQDSGFAAALPLGLILPKHMATPEAIRDNL